MYDSRTTSNFTGDLIATLKI